jgi:hypothetical protein
MPGPSDRVGMMSVDYRFPPQIMHSHHLFSIHLDVLAKSQESIAGGAKELRDTQVSIPSKAEERKTLGQFTTSKGRPRMPSSRRFSVLATN